MNIFGKKRIEDIETPYDEKDIVKIAERALPDRDNPHITEVEQFEKDNDTKVRIRGYHTTGRLWWKEKEWFETTVGDGATLGKVKEIKRGDDYARD